MSLDVNGVKYSDRTTMVVSHPSTSDEIYVADEVAVEEYFNGSRWFTPTGFNVSDVYYITRIVKRVGECAAVTELVTYLSKVVTGAVSIHHYLWISAAVMCGTPKSYIVAMGRTLMDINTDGVYRILSLEEWTTRCAAHQDKVLEEWMEETELDNAYLDELVELDDLKTLFTNRDTLQGS